MDISELKRMIYDIKNVLNGFNLRLNREKKELVISKLGNRK